MRSWLRLGTWLARRFALDRNQLRRKSDRIEAWILRTMAVAFLPLTILTAVGVSHWAEHSGSHEHAGQRLREVSAVLLQAAPPTDPAVDGSALVVVRARWPLDGATHVGVVPVVPGTSRGATVQIWMTRKGTVASPPLTPAEADSRVVAAIVLAPAAVALTFWLLLCLLRWPLNRRRLASWAASWTSVGPRWSQRL
jgi:hypothetical protein